MITVTQVRVRLASTDDHPKLKAYCSVALDNSFVVHDLKIIEGRDGPFLVMPSRKWSDNCPICHHRNIITNKFCVNCGNAMPANRMDRLEKIEVNGVSRPRIFVDIFHPCTQAARELLEKACLAAYDEEIGSEEVSEPDEETIVESLEERHE